MFDDLVYFGTLLTSITFAAYYKSIQNTVEKRYYGVTAGLLITLLICGPQVYHTILMVCVNVAILKCCDRRYVHKASLAYTWLHLTLLHVSLMNTQHVVWIHQVIALRLVGLGFEMHITDSHNRTPTTSGRILSIGDDAERIDPSIMDIVSYAFFFIGLHKGPYYRYRIFKEHFTLRFASLGCFRTITEYKLKKICVCVVGYALLRVKYSPQMYSDRSFYYNDAEKRYLYNVPMLVLYALKNVIVMLLCTCVCTEAGFGVYPTKTAPLPGHGPSTNLSLLNVDPERAVQQEYNFSMVKCYDYEKLVLGPRMKNTLRSWDMPAQYWFWMNINKNMFKTSREIRSACSSLAFTLWSGPSLQQMIMSATLWVYVHLESEYGQLYDRSGQMKVPWDFGFSIMRMFCLIYLTPCLIVNDAATILRYYNSVFWVFHVVLLVLMAGAVVTYKSR